MAHGWRNEFHVGIPQAFGRYVVFSGEYIWKHTHNGYDFSIPENTPITFPVEWERSKIPGYAGRVSVPNLHEFSGLAVFSSVAARFFTLQIGGAGAVPSTVLAGGSTPFDCCSAQPPAIRIGAGNVGSQIVQAGRTETVLEVKFLILKGNLLHADTAAIVVEGLGHVTMAQFCRSKRGVDMWVNYRCRRWIPKWFNVHQSLQRSHFNAYSGSVCSLSEA